MRKATPKPVLLIAIAVLAGACSSPEEIGQDLGVDAAQAVGPETSSIDALSDKVAAEVEPVDFEDNAKQGQAQREFAYRWPRQVSAIPGLVAILEQERDTQLALNKSAWQRSLEEFPGDECYSCKQLVFTKEWKVVANLDRFLSISADHYEYTGGAHGNYWFDAKVWDRTANVALDARDLFESPGALWQAIEAPYCRGLNVQRAEKFPGEDPEAMGWGCPGLDQLTLLLGSSDGTSFDRLGLLAAPYVAGSYAEGAYEVTVPVTEAVLDVVRTDYRDTFSAQ